MNNYVFITGMGRSGTTLIDKILGGLTNVDSYSQPLPLLLVQLKLEFLKSQGIEDYRLNYPLSDQQFENTFDMESFRQFLQSFNLTEEFLSPILENMSSYSGQYYKLSQNGFSLKDWKGGNLSDFIKYFFDSNLNDSSANQNVVWKEVFAESFIPYLEDHNFTNLIIVRDPRDVLASFSKELDQNSINNPRPILWLARQWRLSVAYINNINQKSRLKTIRYEDLVSKPQLFIEEWASYFGNTPPEEISELRDSDGNKWYGNSSFDTFNEINTQSIGRYKNTLTQDHQFFLEALCYAEMKAMNYEPTIKKSDVEYWLTRGPKTDYVGRKELSNFNYSAKQQERETNRWSNLNQLKPEFKNTEFVFKKNFKKLLQVLNN